MAIWGSLIGGMIGFSLGGPFGMLLGSLLGGKISRARATSRFSAAAQGQKIFALSLVNYPFHHHLSIFLVELNNQLLI